MESNQIVVSNGTQHQISPHRQATDVAKLCKDIVTNTAQNIQGRRYVRVEGWQSIANAFGCVASAKDVERTDTGFRAIGQVRKMDTGIVICEAEGFVGDDERTWSKRDEYAKRAMAQTRAISRACRSAFAFVVTMMDAGLETTPAEEVPAEGFSDGPRVITHTPCTYKQATKPAPRMVDGDVIDVVPERIRNIAEDVVKLNTPDAKLRKRQPVAAMDEGADWEDAVLIEKSTKSGEGNKGPWTVWKATLEMDNGKRLYPSTFDQNIGAVLEECSNGETILVQIAAREYTDKNGETKKGYDLKAVSRQDVPSKAEDKDIEWGNRKEDDNDSIPF